jgi:hypothetical protein
MKKNLIRLTESDLHRIIKESVNRIIKESKYDFFDEAPYDEYNEFDNNAYGERELTKDDEIGMSWDELDDMRGYGRDNYADMPDENGNRLNVSNNVFRKKNWRNGKDGEDYINYKNIKKRPNGWHPGVLAQGNDELAKKYQNFRGTRRSFK